MIPEENSPVFLTKLDKKLINFGFSLSTMKSMANGELYNCYEKKLSELFPVNDGGYFTIEVKNKKGSISISFGVSKVLKQNNDISVAISSTSVTMWVDKDFDNLDLIFKYGYQQVRNQLEMELTG